MQIAHDLLPDWTQGILDIKNAFATIGRYPIAETLLDIYNETRIDEVLQLLQLFLIMYSATGTAIMVAADEACLIAKAITDGIDQGCPIGNLIYGLVVAWTVTRKVRARFDPILIKFIIDDLSTAAPVYHP